MCRSVAPKRETHSGNEQPGEKEHGQAIRDLIASGLENSALVLLRAQHEALLRAAWLLFAASDSAIKALGAPHTPGTLKQANSLPLAHELLGDIEKSDAPEVLKRGLREFRDYSWAGVNSYAHAGLLPLGRVGSGHPEAQLVQVIQVSNAHTYSAHMIVAAIIDPAEGTANINVIAVSYPDCMLGA